LRESESQLARTAAAAHMALLSEGRAVKPKQRGWGGGDTREKCSDSLSEQRRGTPGLNMT